MRFIAFLLLFLSIPSGFVFAQVSGKIDVYRVGGYSVALPLIVDGQVKMKLSHMHHVVLEVQPGEHQIESKFSNILDRLCCIKSHSGQRALGSVHVQAT
ncbi:MAG: hypothetical protein ACRYGF_11310, partial [Janthinobacterium lividum]